MDPDLPTAFWYAEVEFETEAQALAWNPAAAGLADYLHDECTGSASTAIIIIATIFFFIRISPFLFCL